MTVTIFFFDNFEGGAIGEDLTDYDPDYDFYLTGTGPGTSTAQIDDTYPIQGTKDLQIQVNVDETLPGSDVVNIENHDWTPQVASKFQGYIRFSTNANVMGQFRLYDATVAKFAAMIGLTQSSAYYGGARAIFYRSNNVNIDSGLRWQQGINYLIEIEWDATTRRYSAWVTSGNGDYDHTPICIDVPFADPTYTPGLAVGSFLLRSWSWYSTGGEMFYLWHDVLQIGEELVQIRPFFRRGKLP